MKLSEEDLQFFSENGYLLIPRVLNADMIAELTRSADKLVESDEHIFRTVDEEFDGFRNLLSLDSSFLTLVDLETTLVPVTQIMGFNLHLSSVHLSYIHPRKSEQPWRGDWHTDIFDFEDDLREQSVRVGIKCAFALTSHRESNSGVTILLPGSHKSKCRSGPDVRDPSPSGAIQLNMEAGDCLLFENRLRHSRGINVTRQTRKCILVGYSYRWVIPLDSIDVFELQTDHVGDLARDLMPRPYGMPGNGAIAALCDKHGFPLRPAKII